MMKIDKKVLEIKERLLAAGIDDSNLVYMPIVPAMGYPREYVIQEEFGLKTARLISAPSN